jgi:Protein of unknown function (DUF4199)
MNPVLGTGILIGVLCGLWTLVMGYTGWYKDPRMINVFFLVIAIEVAGLVWGLRRTAAEGRTYGGQIVAGTMMSIIAGVIIIAFSLVFTTILFPTYFTDLQEAYRQILQRQGKSEAEIVRELNTATAGATPMGQAIQGFMGTLITGIVASAIIGLFFRNKRTAATRAAV